MATLEEVGAALPQGEGWAVRYSTQEDTFLLILGQSPVGALEPLLNGGWRARLYGGREVVENSPDFRAALAQLLGS